MRKKLALFLIIVLSQIGFLTPAFAKKPKVYTEKQEKKYKKEVLKKEAIEEYERNLLPESGYMTIEEYKEKSKDIPTSQRVVPEYELPKDTNMKYIPQPVYKLARYNNPPGSPDLHIDFRFKYDRIFICPGITSPKKDLLVYPVINYYATNQCVACKLFEIPLDKSLTDVKRIKNANIMNRNQIPILETSQDIKEKFVFRTLTPIDFSEDASKLLVKEKIGYIHDGIWQTNVIIYDFKTKKRKEIPEIKEAIKFYWLNSEDLRLSEKRWDIFPLGFDAKDPDRILVSAYGYTGNIPKFLGTWSIDCNGERSLLVSLLEEKGKVSINGYKLVKDGVIDPATVYNDEKELEKTIKQKKKLEKKTKKQEEKAKKKELKQKLKEIDEIK